MSTVTINKTRKMKLGQKTSNLVGNTVESIDITANELLSVVSTGATGVANTMESLANTTEEMVVESFDELNETKLNCAVNQRARMATLKEAGFTAAEAQAVFDEATTGRARRRRY